MSPTDSAVPAPQPAASETRHAATFVLMVDDQPMVGEAVRRLLVDIPDLDYHYVPNPLDALAAVREIRPAVVLLDLVMPVMDGLAVLAEIRADPSIANTPVVMLSTTEDAQTKARAFEAGADDYLVKLPARAELQARVRYHARSFAVQRERDQAVQALRESQRRLQELNLQLLQLSQSDGLTGLANRRFFDETMESELRRAERAAQPLSLLMVDIDHFKKYNDHYGHQQGDRCLTAAADALRAMARRAGDLAARYGGEEFALILPATDAEAAAAVATQLCQAVRALAQPHAGSPLGLLTVSVGHASWLPGADLLAAPLIDAADKALYRAKEGGRDRASA